MESKRFWLKWSKLNICYHVLLMATRNPARKPVEVKVVSPIISKGFITIPTGGWPWDFWTFNSMLEFNMVGCQNIGICNIKLIECQRLSEDEETTNLKNCVYPKGTFSKPTALILVSGLVGKKTPICVWSCSSHLKVFPSHYIFLEFCSSKQLAKRKMFGWIHDGFFSP